VSRVSGAGDEGECSRGNRARQRASLGGKAIITRTRYREGWNIQRS